MSGFCCCRIRLLGVEGRSYLSGLFTIVSNVASQIEPSACVNWYAVATRSRHERVVAHQLNSDGVATFIPSVMELHYWSDRRKKVEMPLFPGYVFLHAHLSPALMRSVAFARGTVRFVAMQGGPVPIPMEQIESIRRLVTLRANCEPYPYLTVGQRVRVRGGALDGVEGIFTRVDGQSGLVVSVDSISRSLLVRVEGYRVEPV